MFRPQDLTPVIVFLLVLLEFSSSSLTEYFIQQ